MKTERSVVAVFLELSMILARNFLCGMQEKLLLYLIHDNTVVTKVCTQ